MNEITAAENKILRGNVIEKLYKNYGEDIKIAILRNLLRTRGYITELELKKVIFISEARIKDIST